MSSATSGSALPPDVRRWLCPAGEVPSEVLGYARAAAVSPKNSERLGSDLGHSPGTIWLLPAGRSHRRTSDGKAEAA